MFQIVSLTASVQSASNINHLNPLSRWVYLVYIVVGCREPGFLEVMPHQLSSMCGCEKQSNAVEAVSGEEGPDWLEFTPEKGCLGLFSLSAITRVAAWLSGPLVTACP